MEFGKELRRRREEAGLTRQALAKRAGLTPNYIGGIETGKRDPSLATVMALARGLRISPGELVGGLGKLSPEAIEAGRIAEATFPHLHEAVVRFLRSITGPPP